MFDQIALDLQTLDRYAIRRKESSSPSNQWFFREFEISVPNGVIWVKRTTSAKIFYTEESVEEFKFHLLRSRPCEIVKL